ncbi:catalase-like [Sitophilus oryzae]|uniref:Catalase n=1 Tax=Sitophilus oryzae TaxID=7048 RepID=A0A6J2YBR9_SITOR|nr:catalase-like [Sitophilus oryzae]
MCTRDAAAEQLTNWQKDNADTIGYAKNSAGIGIVNADTSLTIGVRGVIPLRDYQMMEHLQHFNRERIPERVVHAKGAGAFGEFTCTASLEDYTVSKVFVEGTKTPIAVRFSLVNGSLGSADTVRDIRGFALKFYTEDGIWDLVGNNTPIFFVKDPMLFPMLIHSQKSNPVTNLRDWDAYWDFLTLNPMTVYQTLRLYADKGIPNGYRYQDGYGCHTFSLIDKNRQLTWCKFTYETNQGTENLDTDEAVKLAGTDPDYATRDLYNSIANGDYPSWTFYVQLMTTDQAKALDFDPFDITKIWPEDDFPKQKVGEFVLNRNPENYFAEIEQLAFSPSNLIPGIGDSPDRLLQGRLFAYQDAHRYRLGVNNRQLAVNAPTNGTANFQRDGAMCIYNQGGAPNYYPNSFGGPNPDPDAAQWTNPPQEFSGKEDYYPEYYQDDNYSQPKSYWENDLDDDEKTRVVNNLACSLECTKEDIQKRAVEVFTNVSEDLGDRLAKALNLDSVKGQLKA